MRISISIKSYLLSQQQGLDNDSNFFLGNNLAFSNNTSGQNAGVQKMNYNNNAQMGYFQQNNNNNNNFDYYRNNNNYMEMNDNMNAFISNKGGHIKNQMYQPPQQE